MGQKGSHGAKGDMMYAWVWMSSTYTNTHTFTHSSFTFTPILLLWCGGLLWRPHLAYWRQNASCILAPLWRQYMALKYRPLAYWHQFKPKKKIWNVQTHSHRLAVPEAVDYLGRCVLHKIKKKYGCSVWTAFAAAFCILAPKQKSHTLIHIQTDWKKWHAHSHSHTVASCILPPRLKRNNVKCLISIFPLSRTHLCVRVTDLAAHINESCHKWVIAQDSLWLYCNTPQHTATHC